MWITQTYLGTVEPNASVFIYYLYADYIDEQVEFTNAVQRSLEKFGESYGSSVSLLMPNPNYADKIESEVREIRPVWEHVYDALPGLLIATTPLNKIEEFAKECYYLPFGVELSPYLAAKIISDARKITDNTLTLKLREHNKEVKSKFRRLGDSIELKPGLFGFRIDLRKLFLK